MGDVTWEVDNGEFGSLKKLEHGECAPYWTQKPPYYIGFDCRTCEGSRNLWKRTWFVKERINTYIENHSIRGGDELYLKNKIKYKRTTQMAIVSAGSKPRNISINQSNLNS